MGSLISQILQIQIIINEKINMKGKDIFDREISYKKVQIDNSFPKYIVDNKEKLKEWII